MRPATGGGGPEDRDERGWILRCEGFRVYVAEQYVGVVVAVVYDHSARWDAPHGLRVRGAAGAESILDLSAIVAVDVARGRIVAAPR